MLFAKLLSCAAVAVPVLASAMEPRAVTTNSCARAVARSGLGQAAIATARADCSSAMISYTTTVIFAPASTVTQTAFASATASATTTQTISGSVTFTSLVRSTQTTFAISTTDVTAFETNTVSVETESPDPATVTRTSLFTSTITPEATVTTTITPLDKRTTPATSTKKIPAYASPCKNFAEYAAACSAIGIPPQLITIRVTIGYKPSTIKVTSTLRTTQVRLLSTRVDQSFTVTETIISSTTQSSTFTNIAATVTTTTVLSTTTLDPSTTFALQTDTATAPTAFQTSTIIASPPQPTGFLVRVKSGPTNRKGYYLYVASSASPTGRYIFQTNNIAQASRFTINPASGNLRELTTQNDIYMDAVGSIGATYALDLATAATKANTQLFKCVPPSADGTEPSELVCNNGNNFNNLRICGAYLYGAKLEYNSGTTTCNNPFATTVLEAVYST
ncbi:hypothetical protein VTL71DRAFT_8993 [Oculimacula yallundae]|uniref:Uncharacterized protein n=1 Tax=Oculimacula yallundae TaxID=86028 RepID=A0ABR4BTH5_9HELO